VSRRLASKSASSEGSPEEENCVRCMYLIACSRSEIHKRRTWVCLFSSGQTLPQTYILCHYITKCPLACKPLLCLIVSHSIFRILRYVRSSSEAAQYGIRKKIRILNMEYVRRYVRSSSEAAQLEAALCARANRAQHKCAFP